MLTYTIIAVVVVGVLGGGLYYLRKSAAASADLKVADASLQTEEQRVAQMESAAAAARAARAKEFNAKVAAVRTAGDAAGLLREVGHDDTN